MSKPDPNVIACECPLDPERISAYAQALVDVAPTVGGHGMTPAQFWSSGLFRSAVERIRGTQAATMKGKKAFIDWALCQLLGAGLIKGHSFTGQGDRHDYYVELPDGKKSICEAKGCLDGNNTTIWERPANADEFFIWSLCQNPGSNLSHGVWSGVHTRLGGKIIAEKQKVEALVVWDMLCGTDERACPKIAEGRGVEIEGRVIPPPCIYLFPRTVPDPRNNPKPPVGKIGDAALADALLRHFGGDPDKDVTEVHIECEMHGAEVYRKTSLVRMGEVMKTSRWTQLKRAR
ncbi:MAG: hypothetical protein ABIK45_05310 [Pseudomonadota bacterium]